MGNEPTTAMVVRAQQGEPFEPRTLQEALELAKEIAPSRLIPQHLQGAPGDVYVTLLLARDLGLSPMQGILGIDVIEGRPSIDATTAVALCKASPLCKYFDCEESDDQHATWVTHRVGSPKPLRTTYTIQMAQRAQLVGKTKNGNPNTWMKHPEAMLRRRASMALARDVYPDVLKNIISRDEAEEIRDARAMEITVPAEPKFTAPPAPPKPDLATIAGNAEAIARVHTPTPASKLAEMIGAAGPPPQVALTPTQERDAVEAFGAPIPRRSELSGEPASAPPCTCRDGYRSGLNDPECARHGTGQPTRAEPVPEEAAVFVKHTLDITHALSEPALGVVGGQILESFKSGKITQAERNELADLYLSRKKELLK